MYSVFFLIFVFSMQGGGGRGYKSPYIYGTICLTKVRFINVTPNDFKVENFVLDLP